ncbi:MAG: CoA-binding protein [Candidatus Diapherotrites archaeon]|nr:CoA-binding protein [Candidatus Diapherotrites archaeon]
MNVAIIGASNDRDNWGNKAVRAYQTMGWTVFPINPHEREVEGIEAYKSVTAVPYKLDRFALYVPPEEGAKLVSQLRKVGAKEVFVKPGAESDELIEALKKAGIKPLPQCAIKAIGVDPSRL